MAVISFNLFWKDHGVEKGAERAGNAFDKSGKQADRMKEDTKIAAVGAAVALGIFAKKSIDTASDVSESTSKIGVVFGKSAASVMAFGETSADGLGISKAAALEAAGTFGNLFVSLKLPQAEAAKMSTKMITLAADMASFNNASPEEALEAIRSGLVGETEPLRRFGVNMNDATLRAQAMKMGLVDNVKEGLDPTTKAQAAYGLMLEQTGTAQGDFARTSGGLANQQRILAARFSDLQAKLGAELLPAVNKTMTGLLAFVDVLDENQDTIVPLAVAAAGLATTVWTINKAVAATKATQAAWTTVMALNTAGAEANAASLAKVSKNAKLVGGAMVVVAAATAAVWAGDKIGQWEAATVNIDAMTKAMQRTQNQAAVTKEEIQIFSDKGILGLGKDTLTAQDALDRFGVSAYNALDQGWDARLGRWQSFGTAQSKFQKQTEQLDQSFALMVSNGNVNDALLQFQMYEKAATEAGVPVASLKKMFPEYNKAVADSVIPLQNATGATKDHKGATVDDSAALLENAQALLKSRGNENAYEAALDDATQALKDNGKTTDKHTEKGRQNRAALDQVAAATLNWREAAEKAGASQKKQTAITEKGRGELVKMGTRMGMTKKAAKAYADEVLGIPKKVSSQISLSLKNNIPKTLFGVKVGSYGNGLGVLARARGGPVWGAGTETSDSIPAVLSHNEHVLTAREVRAMGGHGAVEQMRRDAVQGFAAGGGVFGGARLSQAIVAITGGTSERLAKAIESTAAKAIGFNPGLAGAVNFARGQVGKPYIWGGVGPRGYDCSGAMSALLNVIQGRSPYSRRGSTGTFPWSGFGAGPGAFMIGSVNGNPGHMAGTINGLNVESAGGVGFRVGKGARGAKDPMFNRLAHLNGYAKGGRVGDAPYDFLNPEGSLYLGDAARRMFLADRGGMIRSGSGAINRSGAAERMLSPTQTRSFENLVRVLDRPRTDPVGPAGGSTIDYSKLGDHVARAFVKAGVQVKMDSRAVGLVIGTSANQLGRSG